MILPSVMPDELARSLINRICVLNGASGPEVLMAPMEAILSPSFAQGYAASWCDLLARANRITPQAFHACHTLVPFRRAVRPSAECVAYGSVRDLFESSAHGPHAESNRSRTLHLCQACTDEDVAFWGFSYWRRSHQLPGSVLCQKHQIGLREAKTFNWRDLPHDLLTTSSPIDPEITEAARQSAVTQRYTEISMAFAERTQPVSTAWMVQVLKRRIQAHTARTGRKVGRLTNITRDLIQGPWQSRFFPDLDAVGVEINSLDRTSSCLRLAYPTPFYALALAVLFDNADQAISEVGSPIIDAFVKQSHPTELDNSKRQGSLPAAARVFFNGASIAEASRSSCSLVCRSSGDDVGFKALSSCALSP